MIEIDGSENHGGGSVVRIASSLAVLTKNPVKIFNIRSGRPNPGLQAQHISGLRCLSDFCNGKLLGGEIGSMEIEFYPGYELKESLAMPIPTAGSVSLAIQPILIASTLGKQKIRISINGGGTAVKWSPPTDFLENVTFRLLEKMGFKIKFYIERHGFYPSGKARLDVEITPPGNPSPICIPERGNIFLIRGVSRASYEMGSDDAAENMSVSCLEELEKYVYSKNLTAVPEIKNLYEKTDSPGFCLTVWAETSNSFIGISEIGDMDVDPETIGKVVAGKLIRILESGASIDEFAADQIIPIMALAKGSEIKIREMTGHIDTSIKLAEKFLGMKFKLIHEKDGIRIVC